MNAYYIKAFKCFFQIKKKFKKNKHFIQINTFLTFHKV